VIAASAAVSIGEELGTDRRDLIRRFLARFTVLQPDTDTARLWARIKSACDRKGRPIKFTDAWIAAAAVQLNVPS